MSPDDEAGPIASPTLAAKPSAESPALRLVVRAAAPTDADRSIARIDPADLAAVGVRAGDLLRLETDAGADPNANPGVGRRATLAKAYPAKTADRGRRAIYLDETQRDNLGAALGETVLVRRISAAPAARVRLIAGSRAARLDAALKRRLAGALEATPALVGDRIRVRLIGGKAIDLRVAETAPEGAVILGDQTELVFATAEKPGGAYAEIGGLGPQLAAVREMIETPLSRPDLFERLGIAPPRGVLFVGPPGSGKTLLARAVAEEADAAFFQIDGPEVMSKHYGDSEARLRKLFADAAERAPSVIFIDEIDAIAAKRDALGAEKQLERRVVAQLLTLMDGLSARGGVVVMAATNLPDSLDPALRRPGRFDREIAFTPPDRQGRAEILAAHLRAAPLDPDVDLDALAAVTHGFVGADLAALTREAAMAALRRIRLPGGGYPADPAEAIIRQADFDVALGRVGPSVVRELEVETPEVRWSDVGGAETAKAALEEAVIWPLRHRAAFDRLGLEPTKGVLLAGPPGTGKTHLARALAHEAGVTFIAQRGAQLLSRFVGDSERAVRELFAKARLSAPSILFFDELDALAPARGRGDTRVADRVVAQLLTEIDGVEELRGVFLLGATNRVGDVDPALLRPGRFDLVLEIEPPAADVRGEILGIHTRGAPLAGDVDLGAWAERTPGWVGAELRALAQGAARAALRRAVAGAAGSAGSDQSAPAPDAPAILITQADFEAAAAQLAESRRARGGPQAGGPAALQGDPTR